MTNQSSLLRRLLPFLVIIAIVIGLLALMRLMQSEPKVLPPKDTGFLVETTQLQPIDLTVQVYTQGLLQPKHRIQLLAEINGAVVSVSDQFVVGGHFKAGDVLLQIQPADYEVAVSRAQANVAGAQAQLELEQAKAEQAKKDWLSFGKKSKPSDLLLNIPQLKGAQAAIDAAKADLKKAQRDLSKTTIKAPFDGTVLSKHVDIGQYVNVSGQLATLAGTQIAEVRLPLTAENIQQLDLQNTDLAQQPLPVNFSQVNGPIVAEGRLVRIEPEKDPQTLVSYGVAEVDKPLAVGLIFNSFLNAAIEGSDYKGVYAVPSTWLLPKQRLPLLDAEQRLQLQPVNVIYQTSTLSYIQSELSADHRIITTPIQFPENGMQLRLKEPLPTAPDNMTDSL